MKCCKSICSNLSKQHNILTFLKGGFAKKCSPAWNHAGTSSFELHHICKTDKIY